MVGLTHVYFLTGGQARLIDGYRQDASGRWLYRWKGHMMKTKNDHRKDHWMSRWMPLEMAQLYARGNWRDNISWSMYGDYSVAVDPDGDARAAAYARNIMTKG